MDRRGRGHPPGLRGREIGMFYKKQQQRKKSEGEDKRIRLLPAVKVPPAVLVRLDKLLHEIDSKNKESEHISLAFESQFRHLLSISFERFIDESKTDYDDTLANNDSLNQRFKSDVLARESTSEFKCRYEKRQKLPAMEQQERIITAIRANQVMLVVGSTGCGKTTQVPQILLDDFIKAEKGSRCHIVCTQPRRISAISVAQRVAYERCESLGSSVGYQIRLESKMPREHGSILFCTTGILLQKMQTNPLMNGISCIILDEVHERNVDSDLLMALLKKVLPHRPDLKLILMSATVSELEFSQYFDNCLMLRIEGTLFPVTVNYLEDILQETGFNNFQNVPGQSKHGCKRKAQRQQVDANFKYMTMMEPYLRQLRNKYDATVIDALRCTDSEGCENLQFLEYLIFYICEHKPPGGILVFLPGYDKIAKLNSVLQNPMTQNGQRLKHTIRVYPLHSTMPTQDQQSIFLPPPSGMRKVILSTVLAETSVTIEDIVYVVNTGRTKMSNYDVEANLQTLDDTWVTLANTQQRKGRAGRVQSGICYNLFSRARERTMKDAPTPEILRSKLESVILNLKLLHIKDVFGFMQTLLNAPNPVAIQHGIKLLKRIDALDEYDSLSPLGMHLARLPIDPQMGKMILMSALFRCVDPITSVAAAISFKSPFYTPLGLEQKVDRIKRDMSVNTRSDHLLFDRVILNFRQAIEHNDERNFCYQNFLSISILNQLENMKRQFADLLKGSSFLESANCSDSSSNENSKNLTLLRAIIAAGLYPNMAHLRKSRQIKNRVNAIHSMSTPEEKRVNFHPSSINFGASSFDSNFFVYFQKRKSTDLFILDSTMVFPMALLIFGDGVATGFTPEKEFYISVANIYFFKCDRDTADIILKLRRNLQWLMQKKVLQPSPITSNTREDDVIKAIQILLSFDDATDYDDIYMSSDDDW